MAKNYNQGVADSNRRRAKHGGSPAGKRTKEYLAWRSIKGRCYNPKTLRYHRYGARGITMCDAWKNDFSKFRNDVGLAPEPEYSLERIDNNGNYEPGNVKWATPQEQANNRETNVYVTYKGETRTLADWARHLGYKYGLITSRWKNGLRGDDLFADPVYERNALVEFRGEKKTLKEWSKILGVPYSTLHYRHNKGRALV